MESKIVYYNVTFSSNGSSSTYCYGNDRIIYRVTSVRDAIPSGATDITIADGNSVQLHFDNLQTHYNVVEFELDDASGNWICDHDDEQISINGGTYDYTFTNYNSQNKRVQMSNNYSGQIRFWPGGNTLAFIFSGSSATGYIAIRYNYNPPAPSSGSSISLTSNTITLGGALTYSVTGDNRCTHTVTASLNNTQLSVQQTGVSTGQGKTITVPDSQEKIQQWLNALSNSVIGNCTITLTTYYNGSQIGSTSAAFYIRVPDSYVPTLSGLGISMITSPYNATVAGWGLYVQGVSKARLVATGASGSGGSTISAYHFLNADGTEIANISANSYDATLPTSTGTSFGTQFKCYVEDSRGRTSSTVSSSQITVYNYNIPAISATSAIRCNASGVAQEDGTYFRLSSLASFTSIGGKNLTSCTRQIQWKSNNESSWHTNSASITGLTDASPSTAITAIMGDSSEQSADYIVPENGYRIKVTVTDTLGGQASREIDLGTISYTMFFKKDGLGVAIGQPTQEDIYTPAFEVNPEWQMIWGSIAGSKVRIPGVYVSDTEPPAKAGLIWLKPAT